MATDVVLDVVVLGVGVGGGGVVIRFAIC